MVEKYITGVVLDKKLGTPIEYARIFQNGTEADGTETDENGYFELVYDENATKSVTVEADGYKTKLFPTLASVDSEIPYSFGLLVDSSYTENTKSIDTKIHQATPIINKVHNGKKKASILSSRASTPKSKEDLVFYVVIAVLVVAILVVIYFIWKYNKKDAPITLDIPFIPNDIQSVAVAAPSVPANIPSVAAVVPNVPIFEFR